MSLPKQLLWPGLSLLVLVGLMLYQQGLEVQASSNSAYHTRIANSIRDLPMSYGDWIGKNHEVPRAAAELLHANEVRALQFRHVLTGEQVAIILVHCTDARDLIGHYPPVCYPAQGWLQRSSGAMSLNPAQVKTSLIEWPCSLYRFERMDQGFTHQMTVLNYMVLPDENVGPSMDVINRAAGDIAQRERGAMQVQVVFNDPNLDETRRTEIANEFLVYLEPVLMAVWQSEEGLSS